MRHYESSERRYDGNSDAESATTLVEGRNDDMSRRRFRENRQEREQRENGTSGQQRLNDSERLQLLTPRLRKAMQAVESAGGRWGRNGLPTREDLLSLSKQCYRKFPEERDGRIRAYEDMLDVHKDRLEGERLIGKFEDQRLRNDKRWGLLPEQIRKAIQDVESAKGRWGQDGLPTREDVLSLPAQMHNLDSDVRYALVQMYETMLLALARAGGQWPETATFPAKEALFSLPVRLGGSSRLRMDLDFVLGYEQLLYNYHKDISTEEQLKNLEDRRLSDSERWLSLAIPIHRGTQDVEEIGGRWGRNDLPTRGSLLTLPDRICKMDPSVGDALSDMYVKLFQTLVRAGGRWPETPFPIRGLFSLPGELRNLTPFAANEQIQIYERMLADLWYGSQ